MARKNEAEQLLRQGLCLSEIARHMRISVASVIQYLSTRVGEGSLRLSDLYFSWTPEKREALQRAASRRRMTLAEALEPMREARPVPDDLSSHGLSREELELFKSLRDRRVFSGDMYEYISEAEVAIHGLVREILQRELGVEESRWWRDGIPSNIRAKCAARREEDNQPCETTYAYATLLDLSTVISKNWTNVPEYSPKRICRKSQAA